MFILTYLLTVSPAEGAEQIDVEPTIDSSANTESFAEKGQLSPMLSELGTPSYQSDEAFWYNGFYTICFYYTSYLCYFVINKSNLPQPW